MIPCTQCGRHHRVSEEKCPFCSSRLPLKGPVGVAVATVLTPLVLAACYGGGPKLDDLRQSASECWDEVTSTYVPCTWDTGSQDTGSEDTGSEDTGSEDTGSADTGSLDTGSADTGSEDTGAEEEVIDTGSARMAPEASTIPMDLKECLLGEDRTVH